MEQTQVEKMAANFVEIIEGSGENASAVMVEMQRLIDIVNNWRSENGIRKI